MTDADKTPPRLVPERPLPPYTYVPGRSPHPLTDPEGHSYGARHAPAAPVEPGRWAESRDYLHGIDLFNHGYYWEAHEVWEGLWHAAGRAGVTGDFLKGLIQMTAAGVKVRQGVPRGVASLAAGAAELFRKVLAALPPRQTRYLGLDVAELLRFVEGLAGQPDRGSVPEGGPVVPLFTMALRPSL
jgi:uncharacterized protein